MNKKKYFIFLGVLFLYAFIIIGQERLPIEELETINGVGYDIKIGETTEVQYILPLSLSIYKPNGSSANLVISESGNNIGEAVQNRQKRLSKKFVQGQEKLILIGDEYAKFGIKTIIEDRIRNPETSDRAFLAVCKGKTEDYFNLKIKGYNNASEYIQGLIDSSKSFNFFSDNFKLIDAYVRIGAEGRSLVLPYIEIKNEGIEMTGLAVFNGDKMVLKTEYEDARILSLLKNNNVKGMESIDKGMDKYIEFDGNTGKRKVKCYKEGDKYSFVIDINYKGTIVSNDIYKDISKNVNEREKFENDMKKALEDKCYRFIHKMQNEYKMDCIGLGREGAAKFGRRKNIDWNQVISNANIKVKVKVQVDTQGRGDY